MDTLKDLKDVIRKLPTIPAELSDKLEKIKGPQGKISDEDISCQIIQIKIKDHLDLDCGKDIPELLIKVPGKENDEVIYSTFEYPISTNTSELLTKFDKSQMENKPAENSLKSPVPRPRISKVI